MGILGGILGGGGGNFKYWLQSSQQHVAPCVNGVECGLGMRGLRMVAAFWAGIPQYTSASEMDDLIGEVINIG